MFDWILAGKLINRLLHMAMEILSEDYRPEGGHHWATPPARCAKCGTEPWIVRWGSIRIGQQLDGFYYQATAGPDPILLCRDCWHAAIGVDDPLNPK